MKFSRTDLLIILISLFSFQSCVNPDLVGLEVQPEDDAINGLFTDTISIITSTVTDKDSLRSDHLTRNSIGYFKDPVFGTTQSTVVAQAILSNNLSAGFGSNVQLDSAVLVLRYTSFYGDSSASMKVEVRQVAENYKDKIYYSDTSFTASNELLGSKEFKGPPKDSLIIQNIIKGKKDTIIKVAAQLRVKLDPLLMTSKVLNLSNTDLTNNTNFLTKFPGIVINMDEGVSGNGGTVFFDMNTSGSSYIRLYYKTTTASVVDTTFFDLNINGTASVINTFKHDYTGTRLATAIDNPLQGNEEVFIQSQAGVRTKISFPYIKNLIDSGNISVNKAELILDASDISANGFTPPDQLFIVRQSSENSRNRLFDIPDRNLGGGYVYGGTYDKVNKVYRFNMSRFFQDLMLGNTKDFGIYLIPASRQINGSRVVLGGSKNALRRMKLKLTYTKLD